MLHNYFIHNIPNDTKKKIFIALSLNKQEGVDFDNRRITFWSQIQNSKH